MDITQYFVETGGTVCFEETQASQFAKSIAGDFNPIHDPGNRRFCVPGDLLFSVLLHQYGAAQRTRVEFSGMLDGKTRMGLPPQANGATSITNAKGRSLITLSYEGKRYRSAEFISQLSEQYVRFSGQTFPGILVPLMHSANVMINSKRPMVIYKDMALEFNEDAARLFSVADSNELHELLAPLEGALSLRSTSSDITVNGRKAQVRLQFSINVAGQIIGSGEKNMILSGLREYDANAMQNIVDQYNTWRSEYRDAEHTV